MSTVSPMAVPPDLAKKLQQSVSQLERSKARRNQLIAEAVAAGGSLREVGGLAGLSHTQVRHICDTEETDTSD